MSTLLLRLAAPLQSWGVDAKFENRRGTERVPSKSGVIGVIAAALGRRRNDPIEDLQSLRFGVRVDREGILLRDYHTAKYKSSMPPHVTHRYYLADAVFLAGLEGDTAFLEKLDYALSHPMFPLFLGRRSCPPEGRLSLGIRRDKTLADVFGEEPWLGGTWSPRRTLPDALRVVMDAQEGDKRVHFQRDVPLSFSQRHRRFGFRRVSELSMPRHENHDSNSVEAKDPTEFMSGLGE